MERYPAVLSDVLEATSSALKRPNAMHIEIFSFRSRCKMKYVMRVIYFLLFMPFLCGIKSNAAAPNVLLICVDDLRPELRCFGADYIQSPHIDKLASQGRLFRSHYVQAPTCGASRYTLLTGQYGGASNNALFQRATKLHDQPETVSPSMPAWFRSHGYTTVSVGKVSHHPGGLGGKDWNDSNEPEMPESWDRYLLPAGEWQHPRGWMHGLANGEIRINAKDMDVFQSVDGPDSIYPDGISVNEGVRQLNELAAAEKPFFLAIGILRPHLPFGAPAKYLRPYSDVMLPPIPHPGKPHWKTTWHKSGEFMKYNRWERDPSKDPDFATEVRKHYAACVSYADASVGKIMKALKANGAEKNTVVVLWGDHGWHLGEHAVWGKHTLFEESLRSPLIISQPGMKNPGQATDAVVETLDVFPTLCELSGVPMPGFIQGKSLVPFFESPDKIGHAAVAYSGKRQTIRTKRYRLIDHRDGYVELYDHANRGETENIAEANPGVVQKLRSQLRNRLGGA